MPVNRKIQIIVSPFGWRRGKFHKGVDLRTVIKEPFKQLHITAPEEIEILKLGYQEKWGGNIIARGLESGYKLKFIHVNPVKGLEVGHRVTEGEKIAVPMTTEYMKLKRFWQHLHFETWGKLKPFNPVKYFKERGTKYNGG